MDTAGQVDTSIDNGTRFTNAPSAQWPLRVGGVRVERRISYKNDNTARYVYAFQMCIDGIWCDVPVIDEDTGREVGYD